MTRMRKAFPSDFANDLLPLSPLMLLIACAGCSVDVAPTLKGGSDAGEERRDMFEDEYDPAEETVTEPVPGRYAALGPPVDEAIVRELLPDDWAGYEVGLPVPLAYDLRPFLEARAAGGPSLRDLIPHDRMPSHEDPDYAMAAFYDGGVYLIDLQPSAALSLVATERETQREPLSIEQLEEDAVPDWSSLGGSKKTGAVNAPLITAGTDERVPLSVQKTGSAGGVYATIGPTINTPGVGGTGTLISSNAILTAAHNVVIRDDNDQLVPDEEFRFIPRADGLPLEQSFWGIWQNVIEVLVPASFLDDLCELSNYDPKCLYHDWALVRFQPPASAPSLPSELYMDTGSLVEPTLLKNRGYPVCGTSNDKPAACTPYTLYGAPNTPCDIIEPVPPVEPPADVVDELWPAVWLHDCDTSTGHSGSPMYHYVNQRPTIFGIHVASCNLGVPPCTTSGDHVNWMRRITPTMEFQIDNFVSP